MVYEVHPVKIAAGTTAPVVPDVLLQTHKPRTAVAVRVLLAVAGSAAVPALAERVSAENPIRPGRTPSKS